MTPVPELKLCGEKSKKNASIAKDPVAARHLFPVCHRSTVRSIETEI
uniref:MIP20102p n=1 Tax=Drosophila melanogaster TaxID=7227 RepID=D5A7L6_DROME|nr:MIP20102p [Drosophila melanogaster]